VATKLIRKKFKRKYSDENLREDLDKLEGLIQEARYNQDQGRMECTSAAPAGPITATESTEPEPAVTGISTGSMEPETPDQRLAEVVRPPPWFRVKIIDKCIYPDLADVSEENLETFKALSKQENRAWMAETLKKYLGQLQGKATPVTQQRVSAPAIRQSTLEPIDRDSNTMESRDTTAVTTEPTTRSGNTETLMDTPRHTTAARPKTTTHLIQGSIKKQITKGGNTTPQKNRIAEMDSRTRYGNHIHLALAEGDLAKADWWRKRRANAEARERAKVLTVVP
jgi:hypothetical protein